MRHYKEGSVFKTAMQTWTITKVEQKTSAGYTYMSHYIRTQHKIHGGPPNYRSMSFKKLTKMLNKFNIQVDVVDPSHLPEDLFTI